jgi:Protein of unknown function (DUF3105)
LRVRHPGAWIAGAVFVFVVFLLVFVLRVFDESAKHSKNHPEYPASYGVEVFEDQGGLPHIAPGVEIDTYNSRPPTSGPHTVPADWGIHNEPVPEESLVHNMEHGGVVIWYNCDGGPQPLDEEACDQLARDLSELVDPRVDDGMFIVLVPYNEIENRISLTAWQNLDSFDDFNVERIEAFIASFECKYDPEGFCRG